jgi:hypothetical protein
LNAAAEAQQSRRACGKAAPQSAQHRSTRAHATPLPCYPHGTHARAPTAGRACRPRPSAAPARRAATACRAAAAGAGGAPLPEALLFDCDGVIVDTEKDGHRVSFNDAFTRKGAGGGGGGGGGGGAAAAVFVG